MMICETKNPRMKAMINFVVNEIEMTGCPAGYDVSKINQRIRI